MIQVADFESTQLFSVLQIRFGVFVIYLKACSIFMTLLTLVFFVLYMASQAATNIWLSAWSNDQPLPDGSQDIALRDLRLGVYGALGGGQGDSLLSPQKDAILRRCAFSHQTVLCVFALQPLGYLEWRLESRTAVFTRPGYCMTSCCPVYSGRPCPSSTQHH